MNTINTMFIQWSSKKADILIRVTKNIWFLSLESNTISVHSKRPVFHVSMQNFCFTNWHTFVY